MTKLSNDHISCDYPLSAHKIRSSKLVPTLGDKATLNRRLCSLLAAFESDDHVLIIISADPDALASACALKRILWRKVATITVASTNLVKRPDNLTLIKSLKLPLPLLSTVNLSSFNKLVMVDSQPGHNPQTSNLHFDVVIDHHPFGHLFQDPPPSHVDVRPDWGATASVMAGYLKAAKIKPNPALATALFYAIKTDTQNFVRQGQDEDMKAFRWLYTFINPTLLDNIERTPINRSSFKIILKGLNQAVLKGNYAYTFIEKSDHADTLVILADFLMQINTINRTAVAGLCGDKLIIIFRSAGSRYNAGKWATKAFGHYGSAGGHKSMARAELPLKNLEAKLKNNGAINRFIIRQLTSSVQDE